MLAFEKINGVSVIIKDHGHYGISYGVNCDIDLDNITKLYNHLVDKYNNIEDHFTYSILDCVGRGYFLCK